MSKHFSDFFGDSSDDDDDDYDIKNCRKCEKPNGSGKNMVCSRCKSVSYCSKECQRDDWSKHRKACKYLQQERKMYKKVNEIHESEEGKALKQKVEQIAQAAGPQASLNMGIDLNAFNTEAGQHKLHELASAMSSREQMDSLLDKYKDADPEKQARKLLKAIHDNHDRRAFHLEVYQYMIRKPSVLEACFTTDKGKERFFFVLAVVMKNDIREYTNLSDGSSDLIFPTGSSYIIPQIFYSPLHGRQEMNRDQFYGEHTKRMMPGYQPQMVPMKVEADSISWYFKTCWKEHVDLSLAQFSAYKKGITSFMDDIHRHWKELTFEGLADEQAARQIFQSSLVRYNKPFHDPESPSLASLLAMLKVRGPGIDQFKHWVYASTALLLVHARRISQEDANSNIVSATLLDRVLATNLEPQSYAFLCTVGVDFAENMIFKSRRGPLDEFIAARPDFKAML